MLSSWLIKKKDTASVRKPAASYVKENGSQMSYQLLRHNSQQMSLNVDDFRVCFTRALEECGHAVDIVDQWCHSERRFSLQFDEPTLRGTVLDNDISRAGLDSDEAQAEYFQGMKLAIWFREHQNVLECLLRHALNLLKSRKAEDREWQDTAADLFTYWPIFNKKATKKDPVRSRIIFGADPSDRTQLIVTEVDFYTSFVRAIDAAKELNGQVINVEAWMHPETVYTFRQSQATFGDALGPVAFVAIASTTGKANENHIIDAKWFDLTKWFGEHPGVLQRTFEIASELIQEQSSTRAALDDEGELVYHSAV